MGIILQIIFVIKRNEFDNINMPLQWTNDSCAHKIHALFCLRIRFVLELDLEYL